MLYHNSEYLNRTSANPPAKYFRGDTIKKTIYHIDKDWNSGNKDCVMTRLLSRQLVFMHVFELLSLHMLAGKSVTYTSGETKCLNGLKHIQHQTQHNVRRSSHLQTPVSHCAVVQLLIWMFVLQKKNTEKQTRCCILFWCYSWWTGQHQALWSSYYWHLFFRRM